MKNTTKKKKLSKRGQLFKRVKIAYAEMIEAMVEGNDLPIKDQKWLLDKVENLDVDKDLGNFLGRKIVF